MIDWPLQACSGSANTCSRPGGPDAVPLLGWQLAEQLYQMPTAQSKQAALAARWHQRISSAHSTHMVDRPVSADHAAGRVPVSGFL
jgi:hypothetical protein